MAKYENELKGYAELMGEDFSKINIDDYIWRAACTGNLPVLDASLELVDHAQELRMNVPACWIAALNGHVPAVVRLKRQSKSFETEYSFLGTHRPLSTIDILAQRGLPDCQLKVLKA